MENLEGIIKSFLSEDVNVISEILKNHKFGSAMIFYRVEDETGLDFTKSKEYFFKKCDKYNWLKLYGHENADEDDYEDDTTLLQDTFTNREIKHLSQLIIKDIEML